MGEEFVGATASIAVANGGASYVTSLSRTDVELVLGLVDPFLSSVETAWRGNAVW